MKQVTFYLGERKRVKLIISSLDNLPFIISDAKYKLKYINEVLEEGACEIDNEKREISKVLNPTQKAALTLEFEYTIMGETFVERIRLQVT